MKTTKPHRHAIHQDMGDSTSPRPTVSIVRTENPAYMNQQTQCSTPHHRICLLTVSGRFSPSAAGGDDDVREDPRSAIH
eukprot:17431-Eustigmatos_ZCMA.PRE.1